MLDRLKSKWTRWVWGERLRAVHLHIDDGGKPVFSAITLEQKKDDLTIIEQLNASTSLDELLAFTEEDLPTVLVITGKGVITKRIARTVGGESEQVKQQLAEYGNTPVVHSVSIQENWLYISVLRSELLDGWLNQFSERKIQPVHLEIGTPVIWEALRFLDNQDVVQTGQFKVEFDAHGLVGYNSDDSNPAACSLGGDQISGNQLLPYGGLIAFLSSIRSGEESSQHVSEQWENAYYSRAFKKLGVAAVGVLFVLLLINTGLFMYFHDQQVELEGSMVEYQGKLGELESLRSELERKELIASMSGTGTNGRFAFYADQLGSTVDRKVQLKRMVINPIVKRKRSTDRMEVRPNLIEIEGECRESEDMNEWIGIIRTLEVVNGLQITGFGKKENGGQNEFSLEIQMGR